MTHEYINSVKVSTYRANNYIFYKKPTIYYVCPICGEELEDLICPSCSYDGSKLYYYERLKPTGNHTYNLPFSLSLIQSSTSKKLKENYINKVPTFLNAVCGSGKTEILFETISYALSHGDKVCFSCPRIEVLKDLKKRFDECFKNTTTKLVFGGAHDDNCDLLLSTTNQLINYQKEFDLIILDEADAYPYVTSDFLKRVLKRSLKDNGILFRISATGKKQKGEKVVLINRRYHGGDLSTPLLIKKTNNDIASSSEFLEILNNSNRKYIIYSSSINKAIILKNKLGLEYVSSKTNNTEQILDKLKESELKAIVSTTLLERGITIPFVDVVVDDADDPVFSLETLIQICGRVGRKQYDKSGNIYLFYNKKSFKFYLLKKYIKRMNRI